MNRSDRMQPVQKLVDADERQSAERLAASEMRVNQSETKLRELEQYCEDYRRAYQDRMTGGITSSGLRDYQQFLARLGEAVRMQTQVVATARVDRDRERLRWQEAARRAKAIDHVVETWEVEERRKQDRREQRESDERSQHAKPTVLK